MTARRVRGGGARLPYDGELFFKLVRVVNLTARPFVETLARRHRLSLNEWRVMIVLASHPGSAPALSLAAAGHQGIKAFLLCDQPRRWWGQRAVLLGPGTAQACSAGRRPRVSPRSADTNAPDSIAAGA